MLAGKNKNFVGPCSSAKAVSVDRRLSHVSPLATRICCEGRASSDQQQLSRDILPYDDGDLLRQPRSGIPHSERDDEAEDVCDRGRNHRRDRCGDDGEERTGGNVRERYRSKGYRATGSYSISDRTCVKSTHTIHGFISYPYMSTLVRECFERKYRREMKERKYEIIGERKGTCVDFIPSEPSATNTTPNAKPNDNESDVEPQISLIEDVFEEVVEGGKQEFAMHGGVE